MRLCRTLWALLVAGLLALGAPAPMWADPVEGSDSLGATLVAAEDKAYVEWTSETSLPTSGTYKLMNDVVLSKEVTIGRWASNKPTSPDTLVLDLNGHTVTLDAAANIKVQISGRLVIEDSAGNGQIVNTTSAGSKSMIEAVGSFALYGGTVKKVSPDGSHALFLNGNADGVMSGGSIIDEAGGDSAVMVNSNATFELSGGSIVSNSSGSSAVYLNTTSKFIMTGGSIESAGVGGSKAAIYSNQQAQGSITISGGTVASAGTGVYSAFAPVSITGGSVATVGPTLRTRYATVNAAGGSEVTLKSDDCIVYSFSGSLNKITGAKIEAPALTSSYTDENEAILEVKDSILSVDQVVKGDKSESDANINVTIGEGNKLEKLPSGLEESLPEGFKPVIGEDGSIEIGGVESQVATITTEGSTAYYDSLSAAVDNVKDGQTIVLIKATDEKIVISREISFTLDQASITGSGHSIAAGGGFVLSCSGSTYIVSKYVPPVIIVPTKYDVEISAVTGGKVVAKPSSAEKGAKVVLTVTPNAGQELRELAAADAAGEKIDLTENADGTFTFIMPAGDVAVTAVFGCDGSELCPGNKFPDFDASEWYHDAMDWAITNGYLLGFDNDGTIRPYGQTTRAEVVAVLARIAGADVKAYANADKKFADVSDSDWFAGVVAWAAQNGIVEGYGDGTYFGPNDPVTREQLAVFLMRFAKFKGQDVTGRVDLEFPDAESVNDWAQESVSWAVSEGLILGYEDTGLLKPGAGAARAELAAIMMRFMS